MDSEAGVKEIFDLMEKELGPSSKKQDVSARFKFDALLPRVGKPDTSLTSLKRADVTNPFFST